MFGAVAVDLDQEFVRDPAKLVAQLARHRGGVELGAFAHDRLNGVDVVAISSAGTRSRSGACSMMRQRLSAAAPRGREAERGGVALDVMGGAKQLFAVVDGEAVAENDRMRRREPVGLDRHPVLEFAGQSGERLFRAPDRIVEVGFGNAQQYLRSGLGCVITW